MAKLGASEIAYFAKKAGFSQTKKVRGVSEVAMITAIALAESSGNTQAHNDTYPDNSYGLTQINLLAWSMGDFGLRRPSDLFDPGNNLQAAHVVKERQGWSAWSTYSNGAYASHLDAAKQGAANPGGGGSAPQIDPDKAPDSPEMADSVLGGVFSGFTDWLEKWGPRIAMFVGGGFLVIVGLFLYFKSRLPSLKDVTDLAGKVGRR